MRYLLAIAFWHLAGSITFAQVSDQQADRTIVGWVFDNQGQPIPYASVGLIQHQLGTSTNAVGGFLMRFQPDLSIDSDTLVISVLGFKSFRQPMRNISDTLVVSLESHTYELDEIIITNLSAAEVVTEMFKHRNKNYPQKKYKVEAFFRGLLRNDSTYVMMTEAVVDIIDKGYQKVGDTKFHLTQLKYIDERELDSLDINYDTLAESNEVYRLWYLDYMNWSFDKMDLFFPPKSHTYNLDSITYFDNKLVYCISATLKGKSSRHFYNRLFIRMDNFALIEAHRGMYVSNPNKKSTDKELGGIGRGVDDKHFRKEVVQYKPYGGKWYLSYVSLSSSVIGGDRQKVSRLANENARAAGVNKLNYSGIEYDGRILDPDKNNYFRQDELLITHIFSKPSKVAKSKLMERQKYVLRYNVVYDDDFWRRYKQLQLSPNLKRAKRHLKEAEVLNTWIK